MFRLTLFLALLSVCCAFGSPAVFAAEDAPGLVWITPGEGLNGRGQALLDALKRADALGTHRRAYAPFSALPTAADLLQQSEADHDRALSAALARYIVDERAGRTPPPGQGPAYSFRADEAAAPQKLFTDALAAPDLAAWLAALPPSLPEYAALIAHLPRLRALIDQPWPPLPDVTLHPGDEDPAVEILRRRLVVLGDLAPADAAGGAFYDTALHAAAMRFQTRHGLDADGVIGGKTRAALDLSPADLIERILLNLERLRWLPRDLGARHIVVNIAGFELKAVGRDGKILRMPVIVGRDEDRRRTPELIDRIRSVTFRPTWTVPPFMARTDLLPKIKSDPDYLRKKGIRVFGDWRTDATEISASAIDWTALADREMNYRLRQDPGEENALGLIRFSLDNPRDVYLHDTPSRELFRKASRPFSSGCVRVGSPTLLGAFVLEPLFGWNPDAVDNLMRGEKTMRIDLPDPLPVYVIYATAWADESGILHIRDDVYGRDADLRRALRDDDRQSFSVVLRSVQD